MATNRTPFLPGITYHVFNRTNNSELLFKEEKNYQYFLRRFQELVSPNVDIWAYCLMPTHFHFLLTVKRFEEMDATAFATGVIPLQNRNITATGQELIRLASEIERQISEFSQTSDSPILALSDAQSKAKRIQEISLEATVFQGTLPV